MRILQVSPAYGRDYTNEKQVLEDLRKERDFIIRDITNKWDGCPCNVRDVRRGEYTHLKVRYHRLEKVTIIALEDI